MRFHLLAVGQKMPDWVVAGFKQYAVRMPRHLPLALIELPLGNRKRNADRAQSMAIEARHLRDATPARAHIVALDSTGQAWSTVALSEQFQQWLRSGQDVALWIGGPDGFDGQLLAQAHQCWSLGPLTLPHALVRVVVAEQLYRAWSILENHPYHRQ